MRGQQYVLVRLTSFGDFSSENAYCITVFHTQNKQCPLAKLQAVLLEDIIFLLYSLY